MIRKWVIGGALILCQCGCLGIGAPEKLVVGAGFVDPLGFHNPTPAFSWKLPEGTKAQTAHRVVAASRADLLPDNADLWDSGMVISDQSVWLPYGGNPLASRHRVFWQVQFWNEEGTQSGWSPAARFELGLLSSRDWKAKWIRPKDQPDSDKEPVSWLRREFPVSGKIESARLYATARGLFEIHLNGEKVGQDCFVPGWTSYANRIDTLMYDVTESLQKGGNTLGVQLGMGWYAGRLAWKEKKNLYGKYPELLLQLEITYSDGTEETVLSDENWKASWNGPIRSSSIYDGEEYDARMEMPGWDKSGYNDSSWGVVLTGTELGSVQLVPKPFTPVRATEELSVQAITEPEPGRYVFDLGQNMVGWAKLNIPVEKDQTITARFAEMLNQDGTLYTENYRSAKSTDSYTASKTGDISWLPTFTFHGFRYVELSGFPAGTKPATDWVKGEVLHSDLPRTGTFESSHEKLNQLQSNIAWGQRGNFVDIPSDCPQRDERLGWTGDAQVFCPTSMFNYDCFAFWKSWLDTARNDQLPDGRIPDVVPDVIGRVESPGWMDVGTFMPWDLYVRTGDIDVLADNYGMMEGLVGWYRNRSTNNLITKIRGYGDWLQPYAINPESSGRKGDTPLPFLGSAFYAHSTEILANTARVLEKSADAERLDAEVLAVKQAIAEHYFDADGKVKNAPETQTAYLLAIAFDLISGDLQDKAVNHLVRLVHDADDHLRTGFLGTPYIASVLDRTGHTDLAYKVLFKETYPSWFYSINQGATTMWERWNSYSHTDGFGKASMNSFNHYAYGAIGQWMYERIAGLAPDPAHPGYKHFFIHPTFGTQLDWARAELETPYGKAASGWKRDGGKILLDVVVPPNTTATVEFPNGRESETVSAGSYRFELEMK